MGHKTHPIGFRIGIIKDWQTRWFAAKPSDYRALVKEDLEIRQTIDKKFVDAGISRVEIERGSSDLVINIHTARPGIVIGRGGQRVEELRKDLEVLTEKRARLNVQEIRQPELDAFLVARSVADQLERRIAFRRAMRQAVGRTMQAGAQGIKILTGGRLGGADIARQEKAMEGRVPLHTLRADIDFGIAEAATDFGRIGVKVWIYKGEVLEARKEPEPEPEDIQTIEVTVRAEDEREAYEAQVAEEAGEFAMRIPPVAPEVELEAGTEAEPEQASAAEPEAETEPEQAKAAEPETEPEQAEEAQEDAPTEED